MRERCWLSYRQITKWRWYLWGRPFKSIIDHVSLKYLLDQKMTSHSQYLWLIKLLGFDYEIEFYKGKKNITVDALSRIAKVNLMH